MSRPTGIRWKKSKKSKNGREPKKMKNVVSRQIFNFFNFFQLIPGLLLITTNYCFHDLVLRPLETWVISHDLWAKRVRLLNSDMAWRPAYSGGSENKRTLRPLQSSWVQFFFKISRPCILLVHSRKNRFQSPREDVQTSKCLKMLVRRAYAFLESTATQPGGHVLPTQVLMANTVLSTPDPAHASLLTPPTPPANCAPSCMLVLARRRLRISGTFQKCVAPTQAHRLWPPVSQWKTIHSCL